MSDDSRGFPLTSTRVADLYFLEHRAKLIDIAAFLDRVDRAAGDADFRVDAFRRALVLLCDGRGHRARRVLEMLSDPTAEPLASAEGMKGASGAWPDVPQSTGEVDE